MDTSHELLQEKNWIIVNALDIASDNVHNCLWSYFLVVM